MTTARIATRASDLALCQARMIAQRIERELGVRAQILPLKTTGDRLQDVSLAALGGKGLFVKEIEEALLDGRADLAVHSAKDLPAATPPGLELVAFPERVDPRDALVARERGATIDALPRGARVGTGSLRRTGAGLERLGLAARIDERIAPEIVLPAVGQGSLALEARSDDPLARDLAALNHELTATSVAAERAFLIGLSGDCTVPLAAFAEAADGEAVRLRALLAASDGGRILRHEAQAPAHDAKGLGARAAHEILARGGDELLAALRAEAAR
jgi:hydroxymethylbilane synthase